MKKAYRSCRLLLVAFAVSILFTGCRKEREPKQEETAQTKIWSTYAATKVLQNQKKDISYDMLEPECSIQMMKNETEGTQLIISAAEDISDYDLIISDLMDEKGNVIGKEDISVYHQKYLEVKYNFNILNEDIVVGDYVPDMLLPLDTARKYGENKISAGNNQGITVEVSTSAETVPGTYTGTFTLMMDEESKDIPVQVEVWDIAWEGKREFQSSFLLYRNSLLAGEYETSEELVARYQEFFLNYKVDLYVIRDDDSTEKLAGEAVRLFENNNYNSICIPDIMCSNYTYDCASADKIISYIKEIVKISSAEKPYFEYLYIYPAYFDEVDGYEDKYAEFVNVFKKGGEWEKTLQRALKEVKALPEYAVFSTDLKKSVDESILELQAVIPGGSRFRTGTWLEELCATFCPLISEFNEDSNAQRYQRQAKKLNNGNLWAYTCISPTNPYPTFHTDDYNLGTRVTGWMLKKQNVNGYLYWAVNVYEPVQGGTERNIDVYETAERAGDQCGGDGFLCYPGTYYGSAYPFASSRLVAYRDTMDDYDMLSIYEALLEEKAALYGIEVDFENCVEDLYNSLFYGTQYYKDDALVVAAREKLAHRILALQSEMALVSVPETNGIRLYATTEMLKIDGSKVFGKACTGGYEYVIENQEQAGREIVVSDETVAARYQVNASKEVAASDVSATPASKVSLTENKVEAVIRSEEKGTEGATERFNPYIQMHIGDLTGIDGIHFTFHSKNAEDIVGYVSVVLKDGTARQIGTFLADVPEQEVDVICHREQITDEVLKDVVALRISFDNVDRDGKLLPDRTIAVNNIYVEMR